MSNDQPTHNDTTDAPPAGAGSVLRQRVQNLARNDLKRLLVTGVPHLLTAIVLTQGMNMIRQVLLRWLLAPDDIGKIAYVMQIVDLIVLFADLGISAAVLKYAAEPISDEQRNRIYSAGIFWSSVTTCIAAVLYMAAVLIIPVHEDEVVRYFMLVLLPFIPIAALRKLPICFMQARKEVKRAAMYTAITQLFTLTILLVATALFGLWGYFITLTLAPLTNLAVLFWVTRSQISWVTPTLQMLRRLTAFGFLSLMANGPGMLNATITIVLLRWLVASGRTKEEADALVGLYATAVLIRNAIRLLPTSLMQTAFPYLSGLLNDKDRLRRRTWELTWKETAVMAPVVVAWMVLGPYAISLVIGARYAGAYWPSVILLIGLVPFCLRAPAAQTFAAMNKVHLNVIASTILLVSNVPLVFLLTAQYGIVGTAAAAVIAESLAMVHALVSLRATLPRPPADNQVG